MADVEENALYASRVEHSLVELQQAVKDHEAALRKLRALAFNNSTIAVRPEASFEIMKVAYDELSTQTPFLPYPYSVLPALIALRKTHQTAVETRAYLVDHEGLVEKGRKQLQAELSNLRDQQALSQSLQNRIQTLRDGLENQMDMGSEDVARERIAKLRQKKKTYDKDTSVLLKALRQFIDDHLGSMLAAEDLGGPVVGDMMDIDNDNLVAGFSSQGKPKQVKENQNQNQDKRQRRIDEIWGQNQELNDKADKESRNEAAAAGIEMKVLTETLLNSLMDSDGDNSAAYVQLQKETAAARFLVRSKVAQFHPKDSTKLRLIDFGRELDD